MKSHAMNRVISIKRNIYDLKKIHHQIENFIL